MPVVDREIRHEESAFVHASSIKEARERFRAGDVFLFWDAADGARGPGERVYFVVDEVTEVEAAVKDRFDPRLKPATLMLLFSSGV